MVSLLSNLLILPVQPPIMLVGGLATLAGMLWLPLGQLVGWLTVATLPDGRLHAAFLDVGQGDAILITLPDGRQMLIDGDPSATELNWRLGQEMPFWDRTLELTVNP